MDKNFIFARPIKRTMATYKKRGHKPKNKAEEASFDEQNSTTAEVFSSLDVGASKTEEWVARNQNYILGVIGVIAVGVLGYLAYQQFIVQPKDNNAANELFYPQEHFNQALADETAKDSLFTLALEGVDGKYGFIDIITNYSGTKSANLAKYYAGMSYLQLQEYESAINYLEKYSADDMITGALAYGGIGDAFAQLGQDSEALGYYEKALGEEVNDFTTPRFLYKAGITALELDQAEKALQYFERIKDEFSASDEAKTIDAFIGMAKNK